jgi:hypothetical protein
VKEGWRPTALILLLVLDGVQLGRRPGQAHLVECLVLVDGRPGDYRTLERVNVILEIQHVGTAALDGAQLNIQLLVAGQKQIGTVLINLIILHHVGDETHLALQLNDVGDSGHFFWERLLNSVELGGGTLIVSSNSESSFRNTIKKISL